MTNKITSEDVYTQEVGDLYDEADVSNNPVSRDLLLDLAAENGATKDSLVLDIGCANGGVSRKLLERTGCRIEGVELVEFLVKMGNEENRKLGVDDRFSIRQGNITNIPFDDNYFDFVFCMDVLGLVQDLDQAIKECARVLKPNGKALFYASSFPSERLSEDEAKTLSVLGNGSGRLVTAQEAEDALNKAFKVTEKKIIGSQFTQYDTEHQKEQSQAAKDLLKVARLLSKSDKYIEKYGDKVYRIVLAEAMWSPYILLGKLEPAVFVVQKA